MSNFCIVAEHDGERLRQGTLSALTCAREIAAQTSGEVALLLMGASIADLAVYSYTAHAPEGGVPLDAYANVRAWLSRIEALPGFVPMTRMPPPA